MKKGERLGRQTQAKTGSDQKNISIKDFNSVMNFGFIIINWVLNLLALSCSNSFWLKFRKKEHPDIHV